MLEIKDSAIKLFGKEIPLPTDCEIQPIAGDGSSSSAVTNMDICEEQEKQGDKDTSDKDSTSGKAAKVLAEQEDDLTENSDDTSNSELLADSTTDPKTDEETTGKKSSQTEKEQNDSSNSQEKPLKKPDKILPCPRCSSMDTKFCYYNNYNVNQPRHFCKACQRYWTAGGTMRNVPVGAGRRKNKNSSSHYRHITISEALEAARIHVPNGTHLPTLKSNGRVLCFGLDSSICDSTASVLNLTDKKVINGTRNGYHNLEEQRIPVPCRGKENRDSSNASSVTVPTSTEDIAKKHLRESSLPAINGHPAQIPCLPGLPWPYPWNSAAPPPGFYVPGSPLPFYPAPLWNCGVPCNWNTPWLSPSCPSQKSPSSGPSSPTLGKHTRDGDMLKMDNLEKEDSPRLKNGCVLVPKTLRIDDPSDAAKSSIWATLGIKNEAVGGGGMFKAFQPKSDEKNHAIDDSQVLRANPAAFARSLHFRENS